MLRYDNYDDCNDHSDHSDHGGPTAKKIGIIRRAGLKNGGIVWLRLLYVVDEFLAGLSPRGINWAIMRHRGRWDRPYNYCMIVGGLVNYELV